MKTLLARILNPFFEMCAYEAGDRVSAGQAAVMGLLFIPYLFCVIIASPFVLVGWAVFAALTLATEALKGGQS